MESRKDNGIKQECKLCIPARLYTPQVAVTFRTRYSKLIFLSKIPGINITLFTTRVSFR